MNRRRQDHRFQEMPGGSRITGSVIGLFFGGIGLTILIFLWAAPFGRFGSPPLFFRVFGSFIALAFAAVGAASVKNLLQGGRGPGNSASSNDERGHPEAGASSQQGRYRCHRCGAPLAEGAEVSPHGDVKCRYCNSWFNIHEES